MAYDGASAIDVAGPVDVFTVASSLAKAKRPGAPPAYAIEIAAVSGGVIRMMGGMQIVAHKALADLDPRIDTVLVAGGNYHEATRDARRTSISSSCPAAWARPTPWRTRRSSSS